MDDAAQTAEIVALIVEQPTCLDCLAAAVKTTPRDAVRIIERIAASMRFIAQSRSHCGRCGHLAGPVYSLARHD